MIDRIRLCMLEITLAHTQQMHGVEYVSFPYTIASAKGHEVALEIKALIQMIFKGKQTKLFELHSSMYIR